MNKAVTNVKFGQFDIGNLFPVIGDAMISTIRPGDIISYDSDVDNRVDDLYLVSINGSTDIRRLEFGEAVLIKTDNSDYPDHCMSHDDFDREVEIVGRVNKVFRAMNPGEAAHVGVLLNAV